MLLYAVFNNLPPPLALWWCSHAHSAREEEQDYFLVYLLEITSQLLTVPTLSIKHHQLLSTRAIKVG